MDEDSDHVELRGGGWAGPIGRCDNFQYMAALRYGDITFDLYKSGAFYFEHAATILVVQGMILQDFFPPDVYWQSVVGGKRHAYGPGPFLLLKGELSQPWDPPLRLKNMELARVISAPKDMKREELLGHLLRAIS